MLLRFALTLGAVSILPALAAAQAPAAAPAPTTAPAPPVPPAQTATPAQATTAEAPAPVLVPAGCTVQTQKSGQVYVLCPATPPAAGTVTPTPVILRPDAPQPVPPRTEKKWYGWQTLIVDGAVIVSSIAIGAASSDASNAAGTVFLVGYALGGPIVHWANGQVGMGFASLGLRVGAPVVVGVLGGALAAGASNGDGYAVLGGAAIGIIAGSIGAVVVDSAVLARKTVTVDAAEERRASLKLKWAPTASYDPKREAFQAGIGGTF